MFIYYWLNIYTYVCVLYVHIQLNDVKGAPVSLVYEHTKRVTDGGGRSFVKNIIIGSVPDRGGRANEMRVKVSGSSGGYGGSGGGRGGGGGGGFSKNRNDNKNSSAGNSGGGAAAGKSSPQQQQQTPAVPPKKKSKK